MRQFTRRVWLPLLAVAVLAGNASADGKQKVALELAEYVIQRFGRGAAKEGVQALATRIESAAARHGSEVLTAVRKVGPRALPLVEEAGIHSKQAARILSQHGEGGLAWVVTRPSAMKLVTTHGDQAASVLVKHAGGIAEPVIEKFGAPAIRALEAVGPQGGRRMAMLAADGHLAKIGRTEEVLEVIAKYGDRATKFIWANKGSLAVGTALATFLLQPEPFINGTKDITKIAGETVAKPLVENVGRPLAEIPREAIKVAGESVLRPIAEVPGEAVKGIVSGTNWTVVILVGLPATVLFIIAKRRGWLMGPSPTAQPSEAASPVTSPPPAGQRPGLAPPDAAGGNVQICPKGENHGIGR